MMIRITLILATCCWGLTQALAQMSDRIGDWPQWRGLYRDGISKETGLLDHMASHESEAGV